MLHLKKKNAFKLFVLLAFPIKTVWGVASIMCLLLLRIKLSWSGSNPNPQQVSSNCIVYLYLCCHNLWGTWARWEAGDQNSGQGEVVYYCKVTQGWSVRALTETNLPVHQQAVLLLYKASAWEVPSSYWAAGHTLTNKSVLQTDITTSKSGLHWYIHTKANTLSVAALYFHSSSPSSKGELD